MKLLVPIILISILGIIVVDCSRRQKRSTSALINPSATENVIKKIQIERKERRLLRKKKQRLKQLRAEIRMLTQQFRSGASVADLQSQLRMKNEIKEIKRSKEDRWKRKLLEKIKNILRRLDRIENKTRAKKGDVLSVVTTQASPVESTTTILKTSIHPPTDVQSKMKRIKSSIDQSQKGGNGTLCLTHKDCRPGLS
ncbi:unnamed protein product [Auanema sp. JU1783]|nr:unnamed protein product [Auanema sp. JU1783]